MARPQKVTDEEIRQAAYECILEEGVQVSTAVIAEKLGVSQPAVIKRVGSKKELLIQALGPPSQKSQAMRTILEGRPDPKRDIKVELREFVASAVAAFEELAPRLIMMRASGLQLETFFPEDQQTPLGVLRRTLASWLEQAATQKRLHPHNSEAVAATLLCAIEGHCFLKEIGGARFLDGDHDFPTRLVDTLWYGLAPHREVKS